KVSEYLFLPIVLVITPIVCTKKSINKIVSRLGNYKMSCLNLSLAIKMFFETTTVEKGFSRDYGYLSFMKTLFP
ncbi:hypothetical protein P154DRAFT_420142, partial [Amniculicola lignicola CBS 123094]